jgi:hypothetical protein
MTTTEPATKVAKDMLGREVKVGDLVAWGHAGRYACTRIGRVYRVDSRCSVRARILEKKRGAWVRGHHSLPLLFVKIDDTGLDIPQLADL